MEPQTISATKRLNDFLKKSIVPELKKQGFTGKGRVLTRAHGDGIQVVDIQNWKYNDPANASFTIEIGVCFPQVLARIAQLEEFSYFQSYVNKPDIVVCHTRERIGMLLDTPQDYWWAVSSGTDAVPDPQEILAPLVERGLPWLNARSTFSGQVEVCKAGGGPQAIVILSICGRHDDAVAEANAFAQRRYARHPEAAAALREQLLNLIATVEAEYAARRPGP